MESDSSPKTFDYAAGPAGDELSRAESSRTGSNIVLVTGGRIVLLGAWFGATMWIARVLGPELLALYALCQNAIRIFTGCFGDPLDMAVMREAPLYMRIDRPRALQVIRAAFSLRIGLGLMSIAFTAAFPWLVSRWIFGSRDWPGLALLAAVGVLGDLLLRSALGYFQVSERFKAFMAVDVVWQLGRTVVIVLLALTGVLRARSAIGVYVFTPYVAFLVASVMLPRDVLAVSPLPPRGSIGGIIHYSKWMATAMVLNAVYDRLDLFLLNWFKGERAAGIYAAAMLLASIPDFINGCVQTVLGPKVAPAHASGTFAALQRRYVTYAAPLGIAAAAGAIVLGGPVIRAVLSAKYVDATTAFQILAISTVFNVVLTPLPSALLNFVAPRLVMFLTAAGLAIVALGGVIVIPRYGVTGAALLILGARIFVGLATVLLAARFTRSREMDSLGVLPADLPGHLEETP